MQDFSTGVNSIIAHPPPPATPPGICMHFLHGGGNLSSVISPGGWELCSSRDITRVFDRSSDKRLFFYIFVFVVIKAFMYDQTIPLYIFILK